MKTTNNETKNEITTGTKHRFGRRGMARLAAVGGLALAMALGLWAGGAHAQPSKLPGIPTYPTHPTPPGKKDEAAKVARVPEVVVLKLHADWCAECKAMGTLMDDLASKFDQEPVLFITLDLTDSSTRSRAELMVGALGYRGLWDELGAGKKTGEIAVIHHEKRTLAEMANAKPGPWMVENAVKRALEK
jgi:thiol-disulfide isomerase/thioredoxin